LTRQFAARAWPSGKLLKEALQRPAACCPAVALPAGTRDPNITLFQEDLGAALTAPVKIIGNGISGQLRITFTSPEDLERILSRP